VILHHIFPFFYKESTYHFIKWSK